MLSKIDVNTIEPTPLKQHKYEYNSAKLVKQS